MATAVELQREDPRARVNATLGMVFFIGSWSMAFGTLFLSYFILRQRVGIWPPPGIALPSFPMAAAATLVLLLSSVVLHRAVARVRRGAPGAAALWAAATAIGVLFAGMQAWLWYDLVLSGRTVESGAYESLFFGLTWVHAAHVACGLVALLWMQVGLLTGRYGVHRISPVSNAAMFWHFVDVVWVVLFVAFFVL
ncbi:MAG: cytochrome c oxidase subunit 3 [Planctomycetes bacterium]|nr:cytochrome c oxidase subunit 3 [Planctomycetota bacterium]